MPRKAKCCNGCCGCCPGRRLPSQVFATSSGACKCISFNSIPVPYVLNDDEANAFNPFSPSCGTFDHALGLDPICTITDPFQGFVWTVFPLLNFSCDHAKPKNCFSYRLSVTFIARALVPGGFVFFVPMTQETPPLPGASAPYPASCSCSPLRVEYDNVLIVVKGSGTTFLDSPPPPYPNVTAVDLCTNTWYTFPTKPPLITYPVTVVLQE